jgi:hypothetical protein
MRMMLDELTRNEALIRQPASKVSRATRPS